MNHPLQTGFPIVVGINDGSAESLAALEWAASEAAAQQCCLRIVHAVQAPVLSYSHLIDSWADILPYAVDPFDSFLTIGNELAQARGAGERLLNEAAAQALRVASELHVQMLPIVGSSIGALRGESRHARMLVVGRRGRAGPGRHDPAPEPVSRPPLGVQRLEWARRSFLGASSRVSSLAMAAKLAGRARCPLVVVGGRTRGSQRRSSPRVVLGVSAIGRCAPAIDFAFRAARQRGIPLIVVQSCDLGPVTGDRLLSASAALDVPVAPDQACPRVAPRSDQEQILQRQLASWHAGYPEVPLVTRILHGDPVESLVAESDGAALTVLSTALTRHRNRAREALLTNILCPVAIA